MVNVRILLTSAASEEEARKIAHALVERRLAACVNLLPRMHSVYRWEGKVENAQETQLIIKTTEARVVQIQAVLRELHSYELPECIVLHPEGGSKAYLDWVEENSR